MLKKKWNLTADELANYDLISRYPWLKIRNRWTDDPDESQFEFTELDAMPPGWRAAFGEQMCEEIQKLLEEADYVYQYRIIQIKEKYGRLCWYDSRVPEKIRERMNQVIRKYEDLSEVTCIECGKPAIKVSLNWISPWCEECSANIGDDFMPIEDWRKKWSNT